MNIRQTSGPGGLDRTPERPSQPERQKPAKDPSATPGKDAALISSYGRETLAAVHALTERLREEDPSRAAKLVEVRDRLASGKLATDEVYRAVAEKLLDSGF